MATSKNSEFKMDVVVKAAEEPVSVRTLEFAEHEKYLDVPWSLKSSSGYTVLEPRYNSESALYLNTTNFSFKLEIDSEGSTVLRIMRKLEAL